MHFASGPLNRSCSRTTVLVLCSKGFGAPLKKHGKPQSKGTSKTVDQAADQALLAAAKHKPHVRPINPKEAARGKVDYVQVKDWAEGRAADIGELQIVPDSYSPAYAAAAGGSSNEAAAGSFYQQLARHAQYLESQGALSIALEPGAKPFLPFESWQYSLPRYRQYMADLAAVHLALEQAVQLALAAPPQAPLPRSKQHVAHTTQHSNSSTQQARRQQPQQPWAIPGRSAAALAAFSALACFSADSGLWRAHEAQADVAALADLAAARQQQPQQQHKQASKSTIEIHPSQNAVAYGKYLLQLGRSAAAATAAAAASCQAQPDSSSDITAVRSGSPLIAEEEEGTADALKLVAHAYALHVQQQCLGTRIGAAATDHLQLLLMPAPATATYTQYPEHVHEPLQALIATTDETGEVLDAAGRQVVMDELPKALKKATLILSPLATA